MSELIQLYGTFILTVLGFIVPILTILISIFPQGVKSLTDKYENEKKQSEENIANELKKKNNEKDLDIKALERSLKSLKRKRRDANVKLGYLKPVRFLFNTSFPFLISFVSVLTALLDIGFTYKITLLISSLVALVAGFMALIESIAVIFEVAKIINQQNGVNEEKIITLLSTLVSKAGEDQYLKPEDIDVKFNTISLKKDQSINFSVDKRYEIPVSVFNKSDKMAKVVEVGFIFPKNILIEKTSNFDITTTETEQIVRFREDSIQAHNNVRQGNINLTFLESKMTNIDLFIKGENVKYTRFTFKLNIIK